METISLKRTTPPEKGLKGYRLTKVTAKARRAHKKVGSPVKRYSPPGLPGNPRPKAARCNCNDCPPDPDFACSYTGEEVTVVNAYVANAYKGNLVLSPGGAGGTIGGLLHSLSPPQHYSHMGIMAGDFDLVRHCTDSEERLNAKEYFKGSVFGQPAPKDGLDHDHVRYGWPGTVTQSVEQAFMADRYGGHGAKVPSSAQGYTGADLPDNESSQTPPSTYTINALSFDPVSEDGGKTFFPALVVKPCPVLESGPVREALESIADKVLQIYAHYRFYAYTDGSIGDNHSFGGPPNPLSLVSLPPWDPVANKWMDWSGAWVNEPSSWVTNPTVPAVCSSFVWEAVNQVNQDTLKEGGPRILLDVEQGTGEPLGGAQGRCVRAVPPDFAGDIVDKATLDGLYLYPEVMRKIAANWLHDQITEQVYESFQGSVPSFVSTALDLVGRGAFIAAASVGAAAVISLLAPLVVGGSVGVVLADQLIEALYDMPEDIANQLCNAFAFDCINGFPGDSHCVDARGNEIKDIDSSNWGDAPGVGPGDGRAVSPDNIHMFWDPPISADSDLIKGIYGYNQPVALCVGVFKQPICVLVPSKGTTFITGHVKHNGNNVNGAYVKAGCEHDITHGREANFSIRARAGARYKVIARYEDPTTGNILYGEKDTGKKPLNPGAFNIGDICITDPPESQRWVVVQGSVRVDDVHLTGADHDENDFKRTLYVQAGVPVFDESACGWTYENDPNGPQRLEDWASVGAGTGDSNAELDVDVKIDPADLSVDVTLTGKLNPGDENMQHDVSVSVPKDQTVTVPEFGLDTGDTFPDRAYFRNIRITNGATQAI